MKLLKKTDVTYVYVTVMTFDPYAVRSVFLALQSIPNKPMKMAQNLMVFLWLNIDYGGGGWGEGVWAWGVISKGVSLC